MRFILTRSQLAHMTTNVWKLEKERFAAARVLSERVLYGTRMAITASGVRPDKVIQERNNYIYF